MGTGLWGQAVEELPVGGCVMLAVPCSPVPSSGNPKGAPQGAWLAGTNAGVPKGLVPLETPSSWLDLGSAFRPFFHLGGFRGELS